MCKKSHLELQRKNCENKCQRYNLDKNSIKEFKSNQIYCDQENFQNKNGWLDLWEFTNMKIHKSKNL